MNLSYKDQQATLVFIVEDDPDIGILYQQILSEGTPYTALLLDHPRKVFEQLKYMTPRLFILDYHLPSMIGNELYDALHQTPAFSHIPVLMISAVLPWKQLHLRGIHGLAKPIEIDAFITVITFFLS